MIHKHFYLVFILITFIKLTSFAQQKSNPFIDNIPSENLSFILYYNTDEMKDKKLIEEFTPSAVEEIFSLSKEGCVYIEDLDRYTSLTVKFKLNDNITFDKIKEVIQQTDYSISSLDGKFINLTHQNNESRHGFFYSNEEYYTLKLFFQNDWILTEHKEALENAYELVKIDSMRYSDYGDYKDSIAILAQPHIQPFFQDVVRKEKEKFNQLLSKKETVKVPDDIYNLSAFMFFNHNSIKALNKLIAFDNVVLNYLFNSTDNFMALQAAFQLDYLDEFWIGTSVLENHIEIVNINTTKDKVDCITLNKKLQQYIPSQATTIINYNTDLEEIKDRFLKLKNYDQNNYINEIKLALLTIDDDFMNVLQSGILSVWKEEKMYGDELNFTMAFEMPNKKKGEQLLSILCNDYQYLEDLGDNNYFVTHRDFRDVPTYLVIINDIYVIGTLEPEELRGLKGNMSQQFSNLNPKNAFFLGELNEEIFGIYSDIQNIRVKSQNINKKTIKNTVSIQMKEEYSLLRNHN